MRGRGADVCVVALHWGYEHEMFPTPAQMVVARELARLRDHVLWRVL